MKIREDERVNDWVFKQMRERLEREPRTGLWHASEVFGCPRKAILNRAFPPILTKNDMLAFIRGYAVQEYIFGKEEDGEEHWGMIFSPDFVEDEHVFDMKTTNFWYETKGKGVFDPTTMSDWIDRTTVYAAAYGKKFAHITVLFYSRPPEMHTWNLEFEEGDLEAAEKNVKQRHSDLLTYNEDYQENGILPPVTERTYDKECSFCSKLPHCLAELTAAGMSVEK